MRVVTINLWGSNGSWAERARELAAWLAELRPDVVCMQEVGGGVGGNNQATALARATPVDALGYNIAYCATSTPDGPMGLAIAAREPFETVGRIDLPADTTRDSIARMLLHARIGEVDVFCTHLSPHAHMSDLRQEQVRAVIAAVDARASQPIVLVMGDLNADEDTPEVAALAARYVDCWTAAGQGSGATWSPDNPHQDATVVAQRLDFVFLAAPPRSDLVRNASVGFNSAITGTYASDHFGVVVDLAHQDIS